MEDSFSFAVKTNIRFAVYWDKNLESIYLFFCSLNSHFLLLFNNFSSLRINLGKTYLYCSKTSEIEHKKCKKKVLNEQKKRWMLSGFSALRSLEMQNSSFLTILYTNPKLYIYQGGNNFLPLNKLKCFFLAQLRPSVICVVPAAQTQRNSVMKECQPPVLQPSSKRPLEQG